VAGFCSAVDTVALSCGLAPLEAVCFANTVAGISVTRPGTAAAVPSLEEVRAVLASQAP
jgi:ribokinase